MERYLSFETLKKEKKSNFKLSKENVKSEQSIIRFIELLKVSVIDPNSDLKFRNYKMKTR